ncbi:MAG: glycosyltransferase family 2 protein [Flavobacteriales bacterium]
MNFSSVFHLLFSVVIPTYNRGELILNTLDTVINQSFRDFEIVVIDDCSTDNTQEILQPYVDKGLLKYYRLSRNSERSVARNTGMQYAQGEYLTMLDSDDFMYPDCLKDAAEYVKQNPEIKVFQNKFELVNEKREVIYSYPFPPLDNQYKALASGNFMSCVGGFLHKDVYKKMQFDASPDLIGSEDYEIWFRILSKYKVGRVDKVNCGVLQHDNRSISSHTFERLLKNKEYIVAMINRHSSVREKFEKYVPRFEASILIYAAIKANQAKMYKKARQLLHMALKADFSVIFTKRFIRVYQISLFKLQK